MMPLSIIIASVSIDDAVFVAAIEAHYLFVAVYFLGRSAFAQAPLPNTCRHSVCYIDSL